VALGSNVEVEVNVLNADLAWTNLLIAHRIPGHWTLFTFIWVGFVGAYLYRHGLSQGTEAVISVVGKGLLYAVAAFGVLIILSVLFTLVGANKKSGVLGTHHYRIENDGLREWTDANDTLTKWAGINAVIRTRRFIFVRVTWYLFHVLPSRCFESKDKFNSFYEELRLRWKDAT